MSKTPIIPPNKDGIYPKCVYCKTEIYGPGVIDYSHNGAVPTCCNLPLPDSHIKVEGKTQ